MYQIEVEYSQAAGGLVASRINFKLSRVHAITTTIHPFCNASESAQKDFPAQNSCFLKL